MNDLIERQAAIELIKNYCENGCDIAEDNWCPSCQREQFIKLLKALPSAQLEPSEITDEQAILHLQSTGWMQNHDREMYESGLREQLADDGGSYDSLIPCEDAISRQAAIDALSHMCSEDENGITVSRANMNSMLMALPSAQPEIVHCEECAHGVHSGHGDIYLCTVSPEEVREHKYDFYCGYADRRTD